MIQALIIDADGIVIKRDKRFSERLSIDYGISTETTKPFFETAFQECRVGKADLKKELEKIYKKWGWKGTLDELLHYWFSKEGTRNEEILSKVQRFRARGVLVFLATDNEKYRSDYMVKEFGFDNLFDAVFSSAYLGYRKENVGFWEHVRDFSKLNPLNMLAVDDEKDNLTAANKLEFRTELFADTDNFTTKMHKYFEFLN